MLLVIPNLDVHFRRSLIVVRKLWIVARCALRVTRFLQLSSLSVALECWVFDLGCSLLAFHSYLLAPRPFSLMLAVPFYEVCCSSLAFRFSLLSFCPPLPLPSPPPPTASCPLFPAPYPLAPIP